MFHDDYHMFFIIASNLTIFFCFSPNRRASFFREFCVCNPFKISGDKMKENV